MHTTQQFKGILIVHFSNFCFFIVIATFSLSLLLMCSVTISFVFMSKTSHSVYTNNVHNVIILSKFQVCHSIMYMTIIVPTMSIWFCCCYCVKTCLDTYWIPFYAYSIALADSVDHTLVLLAGQYCKYTKGLLRVCILLIALGMEVSVHTCYRLPLSTPMRFTHLRYLRPIPVESNNFLAPYLGQQIPCRSSLTFVNPQGLPITISFANFLY